MIWIITLWIFASVFGAVAAVGIRLVDGWEAARLLRDRIR